MQGARSVLLALVRLAAAVAAATAYTQPSQPKQPARGSLRAALSRTGRAGNGSVKRAAAAAPSRQPVGTDADVTRASRVPRGTLRKILQQRAPVPQVSPALKDRARIGTLDVPQLGIGTIAWLARTDEEKMRIDTLALRARESGLTFFDTAERYGASPLSMVPAALAGVGLPVDGSYLGGDCESNLALWGAGANVATKFTPTPWRRSAHDVVDAARNSAARLGVAQLDLYQVWIVASCPCTRIYIPLQTCVCVCVCVYVCVCVSPNRPTMCSLTRSISLCVCVYVCVCVPGRTPAVYFRYIGALPGWRPTARPCALSAPAHAPAASARSWRPRRS